MFRHVGTWIADVLRIKCLCWRVELWVLRGTFKLSSPIRLSLMAASRIPMILTGKCLSVPLRCSQKRRCTALNGQEISLEGISHWPPKPWQNYSRQVNLSLQHLLIYKCWRIVFVCWRAVLLISNRQLALQLDFSTNYLGTILCNCFTLTP